jgi:uncharacterized lipoprotein YmbA
MKGWYAIAFAVLLAACGSAPKLNYYTLDSTPPVAGTAPRAATSIYLGPVTVPDGVDRAEMVITVAPNQVELDEINRWAEPLKFAIPRVLADALSRELGTQDIMTSRQSSGLTFDYRIAVDVRHFDSSYSDGASLDVLWTLRPAKGEPRTGRSVVREAATSRDAQGVAAAHSRAFERVARDIAIAIRGQ